MSGMAVEPRCRRRLAPVALVALVVCGCTRPSAPNDPGGDDSGGRIARLETQITAGREASAAWTPWYRALSELNSEDYAGEHFFLRQWSEQQLYDADLMRTIFRAPIRGEDPDAVGPVALLVDLAAQLAEHGVDFLVVPVPPRSAVYPESFGLPLPEIEPPSLPYLDFRLRQFYLALERNGVEVVDLLPAFRERRFRTIQDEEGRDVREAVYLRQDGHWSPYGAGLAAEVIGRRVRAYSWFPEVVRRMGTAVTTEEMEWVRLRGPIARRMIVDGKLPESLPAEEFARHWVRVAGERWSFDDPGSPVLVVGTSYTRPRYGLPDALLRELGFRVDRITVPGGQRKELFSAVRSRADEVVTKRLVVWTFPTHALVRLDGWVPARVVPAISDP